MDKPNILTPEEITAGLKNLPGWQFQNDPTSPEASSGQGKISKEYKFKDFMDSLGFINSMAPIFEANDHHPDTCIYYSKVIFKLQRFDVGGKVTDKDLSIAGEIERHYNMRNG